MRGRVLLIGSVFAAIVVSVLTTMVLLLVEPGLSKAEAIKTGGLSGGAVVALYALWLNDRRRRIDEARHQLESDKARRSGRKPGGQAGHPGSTLAQVGDPHERLRHEPGPCAGCGADLSGASEVGMEKRQVFDLPPMTVRVIEHQLIARRCACGTTTCGSAPQGVSAPVGVRAAGHRNHPVSVCRAVPVQKRTVGALAELFGAPISEGTVAAMTKRAADGLDEFLELVEQRIAEAEVAGFDETGLRVAGTLHWVHSRPYRQVHIDHLPSQARS